MIEYENLKKLNQPFFSKYKKQFEKVLESGWYVLGSHVEQFEKEYAKYTKSQHCVGLASGLDALDLSLKCFDFPKDSEIIVPSNTYIATILAIVKNGFKPVLVEPDITTYNIDPSKIEEKITSNTRAIMVVHLYGKCCEMDTIIEISEKHKLKVIEDCAQAHGAKYKGQIAGSFGAIGAHSFYPTKNLGALGDAGAATTDDEFISEKLKALRNYGSKVKYVNEYIGANSRLDEVQASFLLIKLAALDEITEHKQRLSRLYLKNLKHDYILPVVDKDYFDVYHIFNVRHEQRDRLRSYLLKNRIKTEIHYPIAPHHQKAMEFVLEGDYPISEEIHNTTLSLPISYYHSEEDVKNVIEVLNRFD